MGGFIKPLFCRHCNSEITKRKSGVRYCSDKCRQESRLKSFKKHRVKAFDKFKKYKESKGCQNCGYNKYAGALDFHHIDPTVKERRITAKMFYSNSKLIHNEIKKCVLVCKNCHYELHQLMRDDIIEYNTLIKKIEENGDV